MSLELSSEIECSKLEIQKNAADVHLICDIEARYNLYFNSSKSHEDVQEKKDVQCRIIVLVCVPLHQQHRRFGIFQQFFILIRDLSAFNNWKFKYTNLNMKSTSFLYKTPF
jgi:hypothetical protein